MEISTQRLKLRPWRIDDAADLYESARDERVGHDADWPPHRSEEESRGVIRTVFSADEIYAVELRSTGRVVGCVGLLIGAASHLCLPDDQVEVGYWIGVPYWGCGLIPEALEALIGHAFGKLKLSALWCCSFTDNERSRRVQEKCGFKWVRVERAEPNNPDGWVRDVDISRLTRRHALTIREAAENDCALIRRLADEAFPATYREILTPGQLAYMMTWMYSPESLLAQLRGGHRYFIAFSDGEPCGYVSVERQGKDLFHLQKIYVLPRFQGIGAGAFLFRHAVAHIRDLHPGPCRMELNVNRHNRAVGFYERMGMRRLREGIFPSETGTT